MTVFEIGENIRSLYFNRWNGNDAYWSAGDLNESEEVMVDLKYSVKFNIEEKGSK